MAPEDPPTLLDPTQPSKNPLAAADAAPVGPSLALQEILSRAGQLKPAELQTFLRADQYKRWQRGERMLVEIYLQRVPALRQEEEAIFDLIINEVIVREERHESPRLEEYARRFPDLSERLAHWFEIQKSLKTDFLDSLNLVATANIRVPSSDGNRAGASAADKSTAGSDSDSQLGTIMTPVPERHVAVERVNLSGYEILREIGRGGMGVVYIARQRGLNRLVALKMILSGKHAGADQAERFRVEAEAVARLQHPNIVQIYDIGEQEGRPYFSLEYLEGGSLSQKLNGTPLAPRQAAQLMERLADAMHYAHQRGVVHRDLKPANILLTVEGQPKITDFGLAKYVDDDTGQTQTGAILGTPSYMPPEQAEGRTRTVGPLADVYSLGAILYELLTGRPPFKGATYWDTLFLVRTQDPVPPMRLQPKVPRDLEIICLKCLAKEPGKRYASAEAISEDLRHFLVGEPIKARPASIWERSRKWIRIHPGYASLSVVLLLILVFIGGVMPLMERSAGIQALIVFIVPVSAWGVCGVVIQTLRLQNQQKRAEEQRLQAESSRREAEEQRRQAESARRDAEDQTRQTARALQKAESTLYCHSIALAEREWLGNSVRRAEQLLEACPLSLRHWEWHFYKRLCHADRLTLVGHKDWVRGVTFGPDGHIIASAGGYDRTVRLWDATTGEKVATLSGHKGGVHSLAFDASGQFLAVACDDGSIKIWDANGQEVRALEGHADAVTAVTFHPDGLHLATGGQDRTVRIWEVASGRSLRCLRGHTGRVCGVAFHPDGQRLASAGEDQTIRVWEAKTEKEELTLYGHDGPVLGVAYSPDGRRLASAGQDQTVKLWETANGRELLTLRGHTDRVCGVAFSPDGKLLASAGKEQVVKIWDVAAGKELRTLRGHRDSVWAVAFAPDNVSLASASVDRTVKVWDAISNQEAFVWRGHKDVVVSVAFHPNGRFVGSVGGGFADQAQSEVLVWDATTGKLNFSLPAKTGRFGRALFSPDGRRLATVYEDAKAGGVKLWDSMTGQEQSTFRGHTRFIVSAAYSADSRRMVTGSLDGTVKVWEAATGQERFTFRGHVGTIAAAVFSPDGTRVASACSDDVKGQGEVKIWDAALGQEILILRGHKGKVTRVVYSPDGQRLATIGDDLVVKVWDANTGFEIMTLRGHTHQISDVVYSADGQRLVSSSYDQTIKIWEAVSGQEILTLRGHGNEVLSLAMSTDCQLLASASADHTVRIWNATPLALTGKA